ncbi:hypothetical protein [Paenibacillus sp. FSL L8-0641]|uniref:hypothetical protein n=1 Tax=Paenibacillus sp. FSL L8-0641 TaxID=2921605 RepID=UPI0030F8E255
MKVKYTVGLILLLLLSACSTESEQVVKDVTSKVEDQVSNVSDKDNEHVLAVKNGHFKAYVNQPIGETFSKFFSDNTWKYFKAQSGEDIVEFTGYMMYRDTKVKARLQFIVGKEDEFEASALSFNDVPQDELMKASVLKTVFEENEVDDGGNTEGNKAQAPKKSTAHKNDPSKEQPKAEDKKTTSRKDIFSTFDYDQKKKLNLFFSNLSEAYMGNFNINDYDKEILIDFAVKHNQINYGKRITTVENNQQFTDKLNSKYVVQTIKRFFDINVKPESTSTYPLVGSSYQWDTADGEQYMDFSQVENFYDNGNGTYTAKIQIYTSDFESQGDSILYEPKDQAWGNDVGFDTRGVAEAIVKKAKVGSKDTYQVIDYRVRY